MNLEVYDEGRYVECKNEDCSESIPIPDRILLRLTAYPQLTGSVPVDAFLACMQCGHVYAYTPQEVLFRGAGRRLAPNPEMALRHGAAELGCNEGNCQAPATIHIPTFADDKGALRAEVLGLKLFGVACGHNQSIAQVPQNPTVLFY